MSYTCPRCGRTSHHPEDEKNRYCGACHLFEDDRLAELARPDPLCRRCFEVFGLARTHNYDCPNRGCICVTHYDEAGYGVIPQILSECPYHRGVHPLLIDGRDDTYDGGGDLVE